jgi:ribosomal protein S18 acetylase RimI-like enzyme
MVQLVPMTENEFKAYLQPAIAEYAQDHVKGGRWSPEEAQQKAEEEYHQVIPEGLATKDNYFFTIKDGDQPVGMLWFAIKRRGPKSLAYVYDVKVDDAYRRRGYGSQAFLALEEKVRDLGLYSISLHVFGHNLAARQMYQKLGYRETNITMTKTLDDPA